MNNPVSNIKQLNWQKVMERHQFAYRTEGQYQSWWAILKFFIGLFFIKVKTPVKDSWDFVFVRTMERPDYEALFNAIHEQCEAESKLVLQRFDYRKTLHLWALGLIARYSLPKTITAHSLKERLYLYTHYLRIVEVLEGMAPLDIKHLVVFADMQPTDNALVQLFRQKVTNTVTLQHGLYSDFRGVDNVNIVNCKNAVSHHFLAWGEATHKLLREFNTEIQVTICGKPLELPIDPDSPQKDYFTVVMDHPLYTKDNQQLLEIAKALAQKKGLQLNVRLHPHDKAERYDLNADYIMQYEPLDGSQFILGHTSSMLYETMRAGVQVYKMSSATPSPSMGQDAAFSFSKLEELEAKMAQNYDAEAAGKYYIQYTGEESQAQYRRFFQSLMQ